MTWLEGRTWAVLLGFAALGCGPNAGEADDAATQTATATNGTDTEPGETSADPQTTTDVEPSDTETDSDETGDPPPATCTVAPADHDASCPAASCPITIDVTITCDDTELGDPGLRVAAAPERTVLVTASSQHWYVFDVDAHGGMNMQDLPADLDRKTIELAIDDAGVVHLAGDETQGSGGAFSGELVWVGESDGGWIREPVFDNDKYIEPVGFAVAPDDTPWLWFESDPPQGYSVGRRVAPGRWQLEDAMPPSGSEWTRFGLDADGSPLAFGYAEVGGDWQLRVRRDGVDTSLGSPVTAWFPFVYRVAPPPSPSGSAAGPAFAVIHQHASDLVVAWPDTAATAEIAVPDTAMPMLACADGGGDPDDCAVSCHENGVGVEEGAFAIARTDDGRIWIAHVVTQLDVMLGYERMCVEELGECYCQATIISDDTTSTLHVVEIDAGIGAVAPILALPIDRLGIAGLFSGDDDARAVDIHAHGRDLAVGVRTVDDTGQHVRVFRIDTTLLE